MALKNLSGLLSLTIEMKIKTFSIQFILFLLTTIALMLPIASWALTPEQVVVVANSKALHSIDLAKYYMKKRNIASTNLIEIKAPTEERCSREDYEKLIASPIKAFLEKNDPEGSKFHCLMTMYGIPLKVLPPKLSSEEQKQLFELKRKQDLIRAQILKAEQRQDSVETKALREEEAEIKKQINQVGKVFQGAAVDSELALVREDHYSLDGWLPNKFFLGYRGKEIRNMPQKVILVSRLDGPSEEIVRRIIDDSLQAEEEGLHGKGYFDARWPDPGAKEVKGTYAFYDGAIHKAAHLVEKSKRMPVVVDSRQELFQAGECPDAALYCGWYSLAHYVDAFTWVRGAVGYHIASQECQTLKNKGSQVWCKMMLEKGVAATLGPVAEPYVQAFPIPDVFFGLLIEGRLTLAECYALSNPFWSWQMVLIGDPLYRPFKNSRNG
jgi:uncharacterized protein (TIGR03790 family)